MKTPKQEFQRAKAETVKSIRKADESALRKDLLERFNRVNSLNVRSHSDFRNYKESIAKKYSVSLEKIGDWAKDFYIGFSGDKSIDECLNLAFELEAKSRANVIRQISEDAEEFSYELANAVRKEFFNGNETISLENAKEFFFPNEASKEIQGKRIRSKDDLFEHLLHCAFAIILDELYDEKDNVRGYKFEYRNLYYSQREYRFYIFDKANAEAIMQVLRNGIDAKNFHRLLEAYLFEWSEYCKMTPKTKNRRK